MNLPSNLPQLLEETPFGRVTIDIHRAYGSTQMVKARTRQQHKTPTVEDSGKAIGKAIQEALTHHQTGHLAIDITFDQQGIKFTTIETFTE